MPDDENDDENDDNGEFEDSYQRAEREARRPEGVPVPPNVFAQLFGAGPAVDPRQAQAIKEVERRLGAGGVTSLLDHLKTELARRYPPLLFVDRITAFRAEVGDELWAQLAATSNLRWAVREWEAGRSVKMFQWATEESARRINLGDEEDLPMHAVQMWLKSAMCFCGWCWKH